MAEAKLLTIGEAAKRLRVSTQSLRAWAKMGKIHYFTTPTGRMLFSEENLNKVIKEN